MALGKTQRELDDLDDSELFHWAAYIGRKPFPAVRMEFMLAAIRAQLAATYAKEGTRINIADYLPAWLKLSERETMTPEQISQRNFEIMCGMAGVNPATVIEEAKKKTCSKL